MAQGVAYAVENIHLTSILGSIAGDDTIMIVLRNEKQAEELSKKIAEYIR